MLLNQLFIKEYLIYITVLKTVKNKLKIMMKITITAFSLHNFYYVTYSLAVNLLESPIL
jgi:hypothetical protein